MNNNKDVESRERVNSHAEWASCNLALPWQGFGESPIGEFVDVDEKGTEAVAGIGEPTRLCRELAP